MNILDYSQFSTWHFCPWRWWETYQKGMSRRWEGQRDDALTLGSLVHNALDNFSKHGRPEVDQETWEECNPTPECLALARRMVQGYVQKFPSERWPVEATEQPLRFPLRNGIATWACPKCGHCSGGSLSDFSGIVPGYSKPKTCVGCKQRDYTVCVDFEPIDGLAKLDGYFYVPEDTTLESGIPGYTITLSRGWWGREYKTKSASIPRDRWVMEWQSKRQADFQILALQHHITHGDNNGPVDGYTGIDTVQGIMVCVLEKPREHVPRRKCKGCKETWDFAAYLTHPEGHQCPVCGAVQQLQPIKPSTARDPEYFRITVVRSPEQLATARREIEQTAVAMEAMRRGGMESVVPDRDNCVNNRYHSICPFQAEHTSGAPVEVGQKFVQVDPLKYIGLPAEVS